MGVYIGGNPFTGGQFGGKPITAIYLGGTRVWPDNTFPYVIENTNMVDAGVPAGATGVWVTLIGGGGGGGGGGNASQAGTGTSHDYGAAGGAGGGTISRFFIPVTDLDGETFTLQKGVGGSAGSGIGAAGGNGTASLFICGSVTLNAGGGGGGAGKMSSGNNTSVGVASQSGIGYALLANGSYGGGAEDAGQNNTWGGAAGGGGGGDAGKNPPTNDPRPFQNPGKKGGDTNWESGGAVNNASPGPVAGRPGAGGGGGAARGDGRNGLGYGSGGGGASSNSGGPGGSGGPGYVKLEWINDILKRDNTTTFQTVGAWSWTMPSWMQVGDKIDVVMCGGGRGGNNSLFIAVAGEGGAAGVYASQTLTVGTDIGLGGTLAGVVGAPGSGNGGNGGASTCTTIGLTAAGGSSGSGSYPNGGGNAGLTYGGKSYPAVVGGTGAGCSGNPPGGGGAGGFSFGNGAAGGRGQVWVRAWRP